MPAPMHVALSCKSASVHVALLCLSVPLRVQAQFTGQSMETITRDTDRDFFMSPQEAIEYGLVDAIIAKAQLLQSRELVTAA